MATVHTVRSKLKNEISLRFSPLTETYPHNSSSTVQHLPVSTENNKENNRNVKVMCMIDLNIYEYVGDKSKIK